MLSINVVLSLLAIFTSLGCTVLLVRGYAQTGLRLLLWSGMCFVCLSTNNVLLFFDLVVFPNIDLRPLRTLASLAGVLFLLYGFVWEAE